jgi:hypothetical protein
LADGGCAALLDDVCALHNGRLRLLRLVQAGRGLLEVRGKAPLTAAGLRRPQEAVSAQLDSLRLSEDDAVDAPGGGGGEAAGWLAGQRVRAPPEPLARALRQVLDDAAAAMHAVRRRPPALFT